MRSARATTSSTSSFPAHDARSHLLFDELLDGAESETKSEARTTVATAATTRDDMCFWLYTSGSTGRPKGAVHTHADLKLTDDALRGAGHRHRPKTTSAIRWRSCSSPMGSAMRSPSRCRRARPPCCCRSGRRRNVVAEHSQEAQRHGLLCRADVLCRFSRQPCRAGARQS